ncbi:HNH endonuclease signature motif containing protein [Trueperella bialowiezensis]|uniref:HNH endonuclease n=1 Tax=Trueperella bialowiezensis TaxID=312285 RepID=A0A3S4YXP7_9ACTO|nr:HNH endonuclease signature motif containing protein [Trueperella bialowiezensis]VEI13124.1 HNH endonuclease [Trueperella bialowiezensis]
MAAAVDMDQLGGEGVAPASGAPGNGTGTAGRSSVASVGDGVSGGAVAKLAHAISIFDELAGRFIESLAGSELLEFSSLLATAESRVSSMRSAVLARVDTTGDWQAAGARTVAEYERQISRTGLSDARRTVKRARALTDDLAPMREDLSAGEISNAHIDAIVQATQAPDLKAQLSDPVDGVEQLRKAAKSMDADRFKKHVKAWSIKHAPTLAERMARKNKKEERLSIVQNGDGWAISGYLDSLNGTIVDTTLTAEMGVPTLKDDRGPLQRRAAALAQICQRVSQGADRAGSSSSPAHIIVHVPFETLVGAEAASELDTQSDFASGEGSEFPDEAQLGAVLAEIRAGINPERFSGLKPATLDDGTPLVPSDLMALICNSRISRQIFTADGLVLDHGHSTRLCTPQQKRAVIGRDRTCQFPGCHHTHMASDVHHAIAWSRGGKTDIDNLVLLCWYHHRLVHWRNITIYRHRDGWSFRDADGWYYTARGRHKGQQPPGREPNTGTIEGEPPGT